MNELLDYAGADGHNLTTLKLERVPRQYLIGNRMVYCTTPNGKSMPLCSEENLKRLKKLTNIGINLPKLKLKVIK